MIKELCIVEIKSPGWLQNTLSDIRNDIVYSVLLSRQLSTTQSSLFLNVHALN